MSVTHRAISLSKVSEDSPDTVDSSFDLFATPPTHTSVLRGEWVPLAPVTDSPDGTIEFNIPPADELYTDLSRSYLHTTVKVSKADGSVLPAEEQLKVVPGDNFMHSLFSSATVQLAGQDVEYEPNYGHRAYVENLLNYGKDAKSTYMKVGSGWMEDEGTGEDYDGIPPEVVEKRKKLIATSKEMSFYGRPRLSMFSQGRLIPPGVRSRLTLQRAIPQMALLAETDNPAGGAKISITKTELWIRRVQANPALQKAQMDVWVVQQESIKLPIDRIKTHFHVIPAGHQSVRVNFDQAGQKPNRVFVGLVNHTAKSGTYKQNPFKFGHNNLSSLELLIDGTPVTRRYEPNFASGKFAREFMNLFTVTNTSDADTGNEISPSKYKSCAALYAFDISGDLCDDNFHLLSNGSLSINLAFANQTQNTLGLFVYEEKDDIIYLNANHEVSMVAGMM